MRIDGTYRPQTPGLTGPCDSADILKPAQPGQAGLEKPDETPAIGADSLAAFAARTRSMPEVNSEAVAEARRLLESGELDSPQSIMRAAEAMVDNGF